MSSTGNILVVDDDPAVLETLSSALAPPYLVRTAESGARALDIA